MVERSIKIMLAIITVAIVTVSSVYIVTLNTGPGTPTGTCAYGGTWPNCNSAPPGQIYHGAINFAAYGVQANAPSTALTLTNAKYALYHADMTLEASPSDTSTTASVNEYAADNGVMYLAVLDLTQTVGFVDPALTQKYNAQYIKSYTVVTDPDSDTSKTADIVFTLDLTSLGNTANAAPTVVLKIFAWTSDTGWSFTAGSGTAGSPTGMTAAGTYDATGFITFTGVHYEAKVVRINVWLSGTAAANTTASSLSTVALAGKFAITSFAIQGSGVYNDPAQTTYNEGKYWGGLSSLYDSANTRYVVYIAAAPGSTTLPSPDQSQAEWGLPLIYYSSNQSPSAIGYDVKMTTLTGGLTSGKVYYVYIDATTTNPAGTPSSIGVKLTLTG